MLRTAAVVLSLLTLPSMVATPALAEEAKSGRYLHEVVATIPAYQTSLRTIMGGKRGLPSWVRNMVLTPRYVSGASQALTIDGQQMELFGACLPKQCQDSHLRVLFRPDGKIVGMRIADKTLGETVLGEPSAAALEALRHDGI